MFHFDWTINISNIAAALAVLAAIIKYGSKVVAYLHTMNFRVAIMWAKFSADHPDIVAMAEPGRRRNDR